MDQSEREEYLRKAKEGDPVAREALISGHKSYIAAVASRFSRRSLDWSNDDELSIALLAFNEAVDTFNQRRGIPFLTYARVVIHHRLVDYFRRQAPEAQIPLQGYKEDDELVSPAEEQQALENYRAEMLVRERAEELERYERELIKFGVSLKELEEVCPKHRDTRLRLIRVARILAGQAGLVSQLRRTRQLPIKELIGLAGLSRKVLETGRKYIIAVALILIGEDFDHLRAFVRVQAEGGDRG